MKISIVTPVLNNRAMIATCLDSIFAQTHKDVESIIVDGGSTDGTVDFVRKYNGKITRIITEPDKGPYDAANKGLSLASGDVIGILNSDDFYTHRNVLSKVAEVFHAQEVDSCYGDLIYVDRGNIDRVVRRWRSGPYKERSFYKGWMPPHPTFFVRRDIYRKHGNFNIDLGTSADYELMLRFLLRHRITTAYIPEVLVKMRAGGVSNSSLKNRLFANCMDRMAWTLNGLQPHALTRFMKPLRKVAQFL